MVRVMDKDFWLQLDRIVHPRTVAIIGASAVRDKLGWLFVDIFAEAGFGSVYPVNPHESEIGGFKAYPSVKVIPGEVDLAVVVTPPHTVLDTVRQCVEKGVKGVVINTAGFGEKGGEGKAIEEELGKLARRTGTRLLGPNCIGIYCPEARLPFPLRPPMKTGTLGMVTQSGSFGDLLTVILAARGIYFSKAISVGNECDLTAIDFLEYLGDDPQTSLIISYLEAIRDGRRFYQAARHITSQKPVLVWRCGLTEGGARAAFSHTGGLSGSRAAWEAVSRQTGIITVKSLEQALDFLLAFHHLPLPGGRRVAIVSGPGGPAVGASDACLHAGLELPELPAETQRKLSGIIPAAGTSVKNPVDLSIAVLTGPGLYVEALKILGEDESVDMVMVIGMPTRQFCTAFAEAAKGITKPLALALPFPPELMPEEYRLLERGGLAVYPDAQRAGEALAALADYAEFRGQIEGDY